MKGNQFIKEKRQFSKAKGGSIIPYESCRFPQAEFIKVPVNIAESLKWNHERRSWKDFRLYCRFLDLKVQNPNIGIFQIHHTHRYYQRVIKQLLAKGWASREGRTVFLRAYPHVWKLMGINRLDVKGVLKFKYWKIPVDVFADDRKTYLKQIEDEVRKKITTRKLAQIRYALKEKGEGHARADRATFSAKSAGSLFGYRSAYSGSKLREKYFNVLPMSKEESKPKFNKANGRYEEPTKQIAL
jgi:hypothetical protein